MYSNLTLNQAIEVLLELRNEINNSNLDFEEKMRKCDAIAIVINKAKELKGD